MFGILKKDLDELTSRKQINRLENIAVREVEIVDAGQERGEDFITVRLYANLLDYVVDEKSGEVLSGSSSDPVKFVEFWTFTRNVGERTGLLRESLRRGDAKLRWYFSAQANAGAIHHRPFFFD